MTEVTTARCIAPRDDITECPLCTHTFIDPRFLPCLHTFCLQCIEDHHKTTSAVHDKTASCPLCCRKFDIPVSGNLQNSLPRNAFVAKLIDVRKLFSSSTASGRPIQCSVCGADENDEDNKATMFCVDCREYFCQSCCAYHRKMKLTSTHLLRSLDELPSMSEKLSELNRAEETCSEHATKELDVYCSDCSLAVCTLCYLKQHNGHRCSALQEASVEFRRQLEADIFDVDRCIADARKAKDDTVRDAVAYRSSVEEAMESMKSRICEIAERLMAEIDRDKQALLDELALIAKHRVEQVNVVQTKMEQHLLSLETFSKYCKEVVAKGSTVDVTQTSSVLHARANELADMNIETLQNQCEAAVDMDISFKPSSLLGADRSNFIGRIVVTQHVGKGTSSSVPILSVNTNESNYYTDMNVAEAKERNTIDDAAEKDVEAEQPSLAHILQFDSIRGMALLADQLFISHEENEETPPDSTRWYRRTQPKLDVYDSLTLTFRRRILVHERSYFSSGIAACPVNQCVYIAGRSSSALYTVTAISGDEIKLLCYTAHGPTGVTVNSDHNVLVVTTCHKLQEFTPEGKQLRETYIYHDITKPYDIAQLPSGRYVITNERSKSRYASGVYVLEADAQTVVSFSSIFRRINNTRRAMHDPRGVAVSRNGLIMLADTESDTIILANETLEKSNGLPLSVSAGTKPLCSPLCVALDEEQGRLFVAESYGGRLLVFDRVSNLEQYL